jgi:hypothetical protein
VVVYKQVTFTFHLPYQTKVLLITLQKSYIKSCGPVSAFYQERSVPVIKTKEGFWQVVIDGVTVQFELWQTASQSPLVYYKGAMIPASLKKEIPLPVLAYPFIILPLLIITLISWLRHEWIHPIVWAAALSGGFVQLCFFKEPGFSMPLRIFLASSFCILLLLSALLIGQFEI